MSECAGARVLRRERGWRRSGRTGWLVEHKVWQTIITRRRPLASTSAEGRPVCVVPVELPATNSDEEEWEEGGE